MRKGLIASFIIVNTWFSFGFANVGAIIAGKPQYASIADVVEPLVPAVVNISIVRYAKSSQYKNSGENAERDEFFEWFDRFIRPFGHPEKNSPSPNGPSKKIERSGSGFLITEDGYIVTNNHVIDKADEINVSGIGGIGSRSLKARVVGVDKVTDLAVIKVDYKGFLPYVKFGDSNTLRVGDPLIVIGNPFGLGGTVTCGIVSNKSRNIDIDPNSNILGGFIQTDAAINKGNSGGPMFNMAGEVVGVNFAIFSPSGANAGIGFAIPSSYAKNVVEQLMKKGKIERGALSIFTAEITEELAEAIGDKNLTGVLVRNVIPNGAGFKAGLKSGDIIVKFADQEVTSAQQLKALVCVCKLNSTVKILVVRNGERKELTAKITALVESAALPHQKLDPKQGTLEHNGIIFSNISQPSESNSVEKESVYKGIIVRRVDVQSRWKILHKGDVLISVVGSAEIKNVVHWKKLYDQVKASGRKSIAILVKRDGEIFSVLLPII
jgi:serine protease Do